MVMRDADAARQDIRPLRIGLLNLMPDKISTETQLARLLGATPLQIELTLVRITDHVARNILPIIWKPSIGRGAMSAPNA